MMTLLQAHPAFLQLKSPLTRDSTSSLYWQLMACLASIHYFHTESFTNLSLKVFYLLNSQ